MSVFGVILILLGLLIFFSGSRLLLKNLKIYADDDELPELWNSVDSKIEAWKYIFGGFKSNKKNDEKKNDSNRST